MSLATVMASSSELTRMIEATGRRAESFGAEDALARLGGLGYVNTKE